MDTITSAIATEKDIENLVRHINEGYRGESSRAGWTTEADILEGTRINSEELKHILADPQADIHLFFENNQDLVGCVYLKNEPDHLYLGMLTVKPTLQARGLGKKILQYAHDLAIHKGFSKINMTVIEARTELIAWYNRHGYLPTGYSFPWDDTIHIGERKKEIRFIELSKAIG